MERARRAQSKSRNKREERGHRIISLAATIRNQNREEIASDVLGSYTGLDENGKAPEQDADDL